MRIGFSSMGFVKNLYESMKDIKNRNYDGIFLDWVKKSLDFGEKHDFDFVEIIIDGPLVEKDNLISLMSLIERYKISFNIHAPFLTNNLLAFDEYIREASINEYKEIIRFALECQGRPRVITLHPGAMNEGLKPLIDPVAKDYFRAALLEIGTCNWGQKINVCVENMPKVANFFGSINDLKEMTGESCFNKYGLTFDTSHLWLCERNDGFNPFFEQLGNRVNNIHLVDNNVFDKDPHLPLGTGDINFKEVARYIKEFDYKGDLTIEHDGAADILKSREFLLGLL